MSVKGGSRELIWIAAGALSLLLLFFTILYFRAEPNPTAQIAFKEQRVAVVNAMRLALAAASEAQNSAVMSTGAQDAQAFADQARVATAALERGRIELDKLVKERAGPHEVELLDRVGQTLREFQQVDKQLLDLAVQNSNLEAYKLAFGPAMKSLNEMDNALARIVDDVVKSASDTNLQALKLASDARVGALRMQVLLSPHIAEESDQKMDEFEAQLAVQDRMVREAFASLATLLPPNDQTNLSIAMSRYSDFEKLRAEIIKLSRANTDVRAFAIALNEKRKAMLACQDALVALEKAINAEPVTTTIPSGRSSATP